MDKDLNSVNYINIYDTEHESHNRIASLNNQGNTTSIDEVVLTELQHMLHQVNPYAMQFQNVRNIIGDTRSPQLTMRILDTRVSDGRQYNQPTTKEVAALLVGRETNEGSHRDIILHTI